MVQTAHVQRQVVLALQAAVEVEQAEGNGPAGISGAVVYVDRDSLSAERALNQGDGGTVMLALVSPLVASKA